MEWLIKHVTLPKTLALLAVGAALNYTALHRPEIDRRFRTYWYPPVGGVPPEGREILEANERREAGRVEARYRRLRAQLDEARAEGFEVDSLQKRAEAALKLNTPSLRHYAVKLLTEVEMAIPRKRERYIPLNVVGAPGEDVEPVATPTGKPAKAVKKKARRR